MSETQDSNPEPQFIALGRDDPDMLDAYRRASETLEDLKAHLRVGDQRLCSLKLRFRDPDESDRLGEDRFAFLWLGSAHYHQEEDQFSAEFFDLPPEFEKWHHVGERLGIDPDDIFDWMVNDGGSLFGGFSLRVARSRLPEEERAEYDSYVDVSEYVDGSPPAPQD